MRVLDRLPNILFRDGPYHPVIDEARENPYLKSFRAWISETTQSRDIDDVRAIKEEVEAAIAQTTRDCFLL